MLSENTVPFGFCAEKDSAFVKHPANKQALGAKAKASPKKEDARLHCLKSSHTLGETNVTVTQEIPSVPGLRLTQPITVREPAGQGLGARTMHLAQAISWVLDIPLFSFTPLDPYADPGFSGFNLVSPHVILYLQNYS